MPIKNQLDIFTILKTYFYVIELRDKGIETISTTELKTI